MVAIETPDAAKPFSRTRSMRKAASRASGKSGFFSGKSKTVERADLEEAPEPTATEPTVDVPADAPAEGADAAITADATAPDAIPTTTTTPPEPTVEAPNDVKPDEASALALDSSLEKYLEAREATATENATSGVATTATAVAEVDGEAVKLAAEAPPAALRMPAPRAREGGCCFLGFGAN